MRLISWFGAMGLVAIALVSCGDSATSSVTLPPLSSVATTATTASTTTTLATATTTTPTTTRASASTAATAECSAAASHSLGGGVVVTPARNASLKCEAGWRMFGWIGESGDGILLIQHATGATWTTDYYGPGCGGVASAMSDDLVKYGLPKTLADKWGGGCGR